MQIERVLLLLVCVAIVVCTPLTGGRKKHHRQNLKHQKFDHNRIMEKNRTKNYQVVGKLEPEPEPENWGLPKVNHLWKSGFGQGILERAPQVNAMVVNTHTLPLNNFNNSDFDKDKCRGSNYNKDDKAKFRCEPRETIVHLVHDEGLILSPNAVAVNRCDGMCDVHSKCIPAETTNRTFYIRQFQNNQATCGTIDVLEHTRCKCSCPERSTQCTPMQIYDQEQCKCKCPNDVDRKCPMPNKMIFSHLECRCKCKTVKPCSTGSHFDEQKCSCPLPIAPPLG